MSDLGVNMMRNILERSPKWARNVVLSGYRGSHAQGTYIPPEDEHGTDDVDVFGVYVRPPRYYLGVSGYLAKDDTFTCAGETLDIESHELRKFVRLLMKGNPNVHQHLWLEPEHYFRVTRAGRILLDRRQGFFSRRMFQSMGGYAASQLSRMQKFEKRGYMGHKREQLMRKYSYDIKNAAHCIRLLHLALLFACEGHLAVTLPSAQLAEVLAVKRGEHSLGYVQMRAKEMFSEFTVAKATNTSLPEKVDYAYADETAEMVIEAHWDDHGPLT